MWMKSGFTSQRNCQKFILADEELPLHHSVCHKGHITKVIFLCAVAGPQYSAATRQWWDGKLGIWSVGGWELAKRRSCHYEQGAPVWKNKSITCNVYRDQLKRNSSPLLLQSGHQVIELHNAFASSKMRLKCTWRMMMQNFGENYKQKV